jgi:hypothetical protein
MMITTLVVDNETGPYTYSDITLAAEFALGRSLAVEELTPLRSYPLFLTVGDGQFSFRFEYLARFAPAVWISDYILNNFADPVAERYVGQIAGRNSPVSEYVSDLLKDVDWKPHFRSHVDRLKVRGLGQSPVVAFLWEIAQSVTLNSAVSERSVRTDTMLKLFGSSHEEENIKKGVIDHIMIAGVIAYMDFRGVTFRACSLSNCEWINCHFDESTEFVNCAFTVDLDSLNPMGSGVRCFILLMNLTQTWRREMILCCCCKTRSW